MDLSQYGFLQGYRNKKRLFLDITIFVLSGIFVLYIGDLTRNYPQTPEYIKNAPEIIRVASFLLFWVLFILLIKDFLKITQVAKNRTYKFKNQDWPKQWIFNGKTEVLGQVDELYVQSSRAGCLLKTHSWKNFRMTFELKFRGSLKKNIGIIFRSEDLDNYFMLEIFREDHGTSNGTPIFKCGIKPHIRFNGGWEIIHREIHNELDFSDFTPVVIEAEDHVVTLFYKSNKIFQWILPTHVDVNHIESGFKQDEKTDKTHIFGKSTAGNVQEIPFRLNYGMIGFRAHPGQGAIIKDLKVEPL